MRDFRETFDRLRASRFSDVAGTRLSLTLPISERLLNEIVSASVPPSAPVRDVTVQPKRGGRFRVGARLVRADFLPPITLTVEIERQPQPPEFVLVFRLLTMPGLLTLAGAAFSAGSLLPPGVRFEHQRLSIDLRTLLERAGYGDVVQFLQSAAVSTDEGRVVLDVEMKV